MKVRFLFTLGILAPECETKNPFVKTSEPKDLFITESQGIGLNRFTPALGKEFNCLYKDYPKDKLLFKAEWIKEIELNMHGLQPNNLNYDCINFNYERAKIEKGELILIYTQQAYFIVKTKKEGYSISLDIDHRNELQKQVEEKVIPAMKELGFEILMKSFKEEIDN